MWCRVSSGQLPSTNDSRPAAQLHGVVGHEPVAPDDQVERAFALADPALPDDEDAEPEDVHEHAVDDGPRAPGKCRGRPPSRDMAIRRPARGPEQRHRRRGGLGQARAAESSPCGDRAGRECRARRAAAASHAAICRLPAIRDSGFRSRRRSRTRPALQVGVESREREAGLLRIGMVMRRSRPAAPASSSRSRPAPGDRPNFVEHRRTSHRRVVSERSAVVPFAVDADPCQSGSIKPRLPSLRRYRMFTASVSALRKTTKALRPPSSRSAASSIDIGLTA